MKKSIFILLLFALNCVCTYAQRKSPVLYKGTLGTMPVTLYLKALPNECGGPDMYMAMYKYNSKNKWLQLYVSTNEKSNWCLIEVGFTGVMILKVADKTMTGSWISPDGKQQLKVNLKQEPLPANEVKNMEDKLEELNHENFDC